MKRLGGDQMTLSKLAHAQCAYNDLKKLILLFERWREANPCCSVRESKYACALVLEALRALERKAQYHPMPDDEEIRALLLRLLDETLDPEGPPRHKRALLFCIDKKRGRPGKRPLRCFRNEGDATASSRASSLAFPLPAPAASVVALPRPREAMAACVVSLARDSGASVRGRSFCASRPPLGRCRRTRRSSRPC